MWKYEARPLGPIRQLNSVDQAPELLFGAMKLAPVMESVWSRTFGPAVAEAF